MQKRAGWCPCPSELAIAEQRRSQQHGPPEHVGASFRTGITYCRPQTPSWQDRNVTVWNAMRHRNRPAPNRHLNKKAGSNCREVCKKITAYGTGDGCQRQTAPEPVAASNGETEFLKTQPKNCKSQSRWPQGRTSCHTQQAHNVPSLLVPDPHPHATLVLTRGKAAVSAEDNDGGHHAEQN